MHNGAWHSLNCSIFVLALLFLFYQQLVLALVCLLSIYYSIIICVSGIDSSGILLLLWHSHVLFLWYLKINDLFFFSGVSCSPMILKTHTIIALCIWNACYCRSIYHKRTIRTLNPGEVFNLFVKIP